MQYKLRSAIFRLNWLSSKFQSHSVARQTASRTLFFIFFSCASHTMDKRQPPATDWQPTIHVCCAGCSITTAPGHDVRCVRLVASHSRRPRVAVLPLPWLNSIPEMNQPVPSVRSPSSVKSNRAVQSFYTTSNYLSLSITN